MEMDGLGASHNPSRADLAALGGGASRGASRNDLASLDQMLAAPRGSRVNLTPFDRPMPRPTSPLLGSDVRARGGVFADSAVRPEQPSPDLVPAFSAPPSPFEVAQPKMDALERVGKNMSLAELSDMGTGDYRQPSFIVQYEADGSTISPLTYESHRIVHGKAVIPEPMPHVRARPAPPPAGPLSHAEGNSGAAAEEEMAAAAQEEAAAATTLIVTMVDRHTGLRLDCHFTAMHHLEVEHPRA